MRKRPENRILVVVGVGLGLVILGRLGALSPLNKVLSAVGSPVQGLSRSLGSKTGGFFSFIASIKDLDKRNSELSREVNDLRTQLAADAEMRIQDAALKQQLGYSGGSTVNSVPAQILAYQPDNFRAFVTINRGKHSGLANGMAVTSQGALVGKLVNTQDATAQVFLLNDPDFRVAVVDQESRASGIIHGQIGNGLTLANVPQDQLIKSGDTLVTSGLGGDFPKGLIVGRIESVSHKDNAIFQSAQVVSSVAVDKLALVFVLTQP